MTARRRIKEIAVYSGARLQAHRAACLLEEHGIACRLICDESPVVYASRRAWSQKPDCCILVAAEQVSQAQQLLAPLQLLESRQASRIARGIGWWFVGMALCAMGGTVFLFAAMFGPRSNAIGALACYIALLVLLIGASRRSSRSVERERQ